ncbi:MAG TPA: 3-dehydroquinate synthase [Planctomycetaceae bacterium]|nr:3-dehydroquinate synthase [Planctomycetaceae bacterium]
MTGLASPGLSDEVVRVALGERSYDIAIATGQLPAFAERLAQWFEAHGIIGGRNGVLLVTDGHVCDKHACVVGASLHLAGYHCEVAVLEPGEETKSLASASELYDRLVAMHAGRQTVVVAVGGGVIGDLAGFVAATYARGLPFVQVPTTLLAQVDSSVGGKVGVNHPQGKNLIGAFHQPLGVFLDTSVLDSLPVRDYRSGLAEVVKYGVILDDAFFSYLEANVAGLNLRLPEVLRHVVARSCRLKADVVERDEFERTGLRSVLNYGHTFGHAFEALTGYGQLLHGEAVSIGMTYAARLALRLARIDQATLGRQTALLEALGLPTELPEGLKLNSDNVVERMRLDKKAVSGRLRFVLPARMGHAELVDDIAESDVRAVLEPIEP